MITDPIADMLTRIRNAAKARKSVVRLPHSKLKKNILDILVQHGYISKVEEEKTGQFPELVIDLDIDKDVTLRRISKPGQRIYIGRDNLKPVLNNLGISIVSTSQGLMTNKEARNKGIGGEIICEAY